MKAKTKELIAEILKQAYACEIRVAWRSVLVAQGQNKGHWRGPKGSDIVARREYQAGDARKNIDFAATALTGGQIVQAKVFKEPRQKNILMLTDVGPSTDFGTVEKTKRERAAELTAWLIRCTDESRDRAGVIVYSDDEVENQIGPGHPGSVLIPALSGIIESDNQSTGSGSNSSLLNRLRRVALGLLDVLYVSDLLRLLQGLISFARLTVVGTEHQKLNGGTSEEKSSGLAKALKRLPSTRSLVFIISDFHLTQKDNAALRRASARHDVVALLIEDPRERALPQGWGACVLRDLRSGRTKSVWLTRKCRGLYAEAYEQQRARLIAGLRKVGCQCQVFSTCEDIKSALPKMMEMFSLHRHH